MTITASTDTTLTILTPGTHILQVEFVANDHAPFDPRVIAEGHVRGDGMNRAPARPVAQTAPADSTRVAGLAAMLLRPQLVLLAGSGRVLALGACTALLVGCLRADRP